MRLSSPPPPRPRLPPKKRFSWGRAIYLSLLAGMAYSGLRWGMDYLLYIKVPGVLEGENIKIESHVQARIVKIGLNIGQPVTKGERLVYLDTQDIDQQIMQQQNRIQELDANCRMERQQLPLMVRERQTQLALEQDKYNLRKLQLEAEMEQNRLQQQEYEKKAARFGEQMGHADRLKAAKAITKAEYQTIRQQLEEAQGKLVQLEAGQRALNDESAQVEKSLASLSLQIEEISAQIQGKSKLPFYQAQLSSAKQELELLKASLQQRIILAPTGGVISAVYARAGEVALPGRPLGIITTAQNLHLNAFFEAEQQKYLQPNQTVTVIFDNEKQSQGIISRIHPVADSVPPQLQPRFEPPKQMLVAEIYPKSAQDWPDTCGMGAKVVINRW